MINKINENFLMKNEPTNKLSTSNTSGVTGVHWGKPKFKHIAKIGMNGKSLYLGMFDIFNEAVAIRRSAEEVALFFKRIELDNIKVKNIGTKDISIVGIIAKSALELEIKLLKVTPEPRAKVQGGAL